MAMSVCSLSSFSPVQTALTRSSSSSSIRLVSNVRTVRFATFAAATPKPAAAATTTPAKREPRGITKPRPISPAMQELLGVPEIPRTQALKQIWAYIKQHNLQDPENKKIIVCDEKLKKIFAGKDRVGFLEISGLLNPHFIK
ncbi:hypothetical protein ACHQM5_025059 [Ranunculus cassubicifolius]